jgi:hypothetical protein
MRINLLSILLILTAIPSRAQDTLKMFLNENFEVVKKGEPAVILRKSVMSKGGYHINYQYVDGRMIETGVYSSIVPRLENGPFRFYNIAGQLYAEGTLEEGRMSGTWIYYCPEKLDERVLEAVRNSDDWKPARLEGRIVNQTFMVPFNF